MSTELTIIKQPENWIHYSGSPVQIVMYNNKYQEQDMGRYSKPKGLWITPEYAQHNWFDWCTSENFRIGELNFIHDVKFKSDANLLRLENADDIDKFTAEYGYSRLAEIFPDRGNDKDGIRWEKVAKKYHGILIPTYIWDRRLMAGADWYYPWDCASGCIWAASAIESIAVRSTVSAGCVSKDVSIARTSRTSDKKIGSG